MIRRTLPTALSLLVGLTILVISSGVQAATPLVTDSRIRTYVFNENEVFKLVTEFGYQSNIEFSEDESVMTLSVGDVSGFKISPAGNRIFIRALKADMHTNLTVITNQRVYQFELSSFVKRDDDIIYVMRFYYPEEDFDIATGQPVALDNANPYAAPLPFQPIQANANNMRPVPSSVPRKFMAGSRPPVPTTLDNFDDTVNPSELPPQLPATSAPQMFPSPNAAAAGQVMVKEPLTQRVMVEAAKIGVSRVNADDNANSGEDYVDNVFDEAGQQMASLGLQGDATPEEKLFVDSANAIPSYVNTGHKNYDYTLEGSDKIAPWQIFDVDGHTYFKFPDKMEGKPTIFTANSSNPKKLDIEEEGAYMKISGVHEKLRISSAGEQVIIYNEAEL